MNNEPVAWMLADKEAEHIRSIMAVQHDFVPQGCVEIPLYTHPVKEHFEDEPQAEELHEIMQSNTHPVEEQDESFDRTASHMAGEYVSWTSCVACGQRVTGDSIHTCSPQLKQLTDEEIIESLAELEHEQWMKWADTIMQIEKISDARFARWASCMIPYADLTEEMKEFDREWARKALAILRKAQGK